MIATFAFSTTRWDRPLCKRNEHGCYRDDGSLSLRERERVGGSVDRGAPVGLRAVADRADDLACRRVRYVETSVALRPDPATADMSWLASIWAFSSAPKRRARLESQSQVSITITADSEPQVLL